MVHSVNNSIPTDTIVQPIIEWLRLWRQPGFGLKGLFSKKERKIISNWSLADFLNDRNAAMTAAVRLGRLIFFLNPVKLKAFNVRVWTKWKVVDIKKSKKNGSKNIRCNWNFRKFRLFWSSYVLKRIDLSSNSEIKVQIGTQCYKILIRLNTLVWRS